MGALRVRPFFFAQVKPNLTTEDTEAEEGKLQIVRFLGSSDLTGVASLPFLCAL